MAAKYTKDSMKVTEIGTYLCRVEGELVVAECYDVGSRGQLSWMQLGVDYDWWYHSTPPTSIKVICKLDLEKIVEAAENQL